MTTVVQASVEPRVERTTDGSVDTVIGCVDTGRAELNVAVSDDTIDLSLAEVLEDEEKELAAANALVEGRAHTYVLLDDEGLDGLIRLLTQAREVRRLASADEAGSTSAEGGGAVAP